ncbi:MAG: DUF6781 family protein [Rhodocyclaceae bacterium]|nr:hypothetical protein [Rhodocyclaceae bacterium]MCP5231229.1 hypothetical protein [Zoogloeaceae bacterium]MCP5241425.1 hypothetical protein [Zoogloeaceae bacterium]MCP5252992.1 hypothetical protein [Zoogloeaceae bacterium]MCP5293258.1 hypothetical protein [Zoogloeaceae bacterium]
MTQDTDRIEDDVERAVADDTAGISERVRQITLKVLSQGQLDNTALKEVMGAVVSGARKGIKRPDEASGTALREAVKGLDQALASAAEATQLAVREATSRSSEFSRQSIHKTIHELGSVESMFIDTLGDAARESTGHVRDTLQNLAEHARNSGTAVGGRVQDALSQLTQAVADVTHEQVQAGAQTLRHQASLMAGIAAGMLKGIADRLQAPTPPATPPKDERD